MQSWKQLILDKVQADGAKALLYASELSKHMTLQDFDSPSYRCAPSMSQDTLQKVIHMQYEDSKRALQDLLLHQTQMKQNASKKQKTKSSG